MIGQRTYVLAAEAGQRLVAKLKSKNDCVLFDTASADTNYITNGADNIFTFVNRCTTPSSFTLTVSLQ